MESLYKPFLYIHIFGGFCAILSLFIPIFSKKGGKWHKSTGKLYFYSMMLTTLSAFIVSIIKSNYFLLYVSVFSFYFALAGNRIITLGKESTFSFFDKFIFLICAVSSIIMIGFALISQDFVLLIFGLLFLMGIKNAFKFYRSSLKKRKAAYLLLHVQYMLGSGIATVTAFLVVNIKIQQQWIIWLAPTFIGTLVIIYFIRQIKQKTVKA